MSFNINTLGTISLSILVAGLIFGSPSIAAVSAVSMDELYSETPGRHLDEATVPKSFAYTAMESDASSENADSYRATTESQTIQLQEEDEEISITPKKEVTTKKKNLASRKIKTKKNRR